MNELLKEGLGAVKLMVVMLILCHEEGMEAVDGFEFEVGVLILGDGRFKIDIDQGVDISEFSEELEDTLVTDFSDGDFDTSQVEDHLTE